MTIQHSKPSITVFADASLYSSHKVAGWGGWARGDDREPIIHGGVAVFHTDTSVTELWALALFVERLISDGYLRQADRSIILQSDSLGALNMLNAKMSNSWATSKKQGGSDIKRARSVQPDAEEPIARICDALSFLEVVYLRHVKGHQGGRHARSWVNEQCDKRAKAEARAQIGAVA